MIIDYQRVNLDSKKLALKIDKDKYYAIHPIPAGGIAVGVAMAEVLKLPLLSIGEYSQYTDKKKVLVVDDLVDSGKTLLRYPESDTAVLYKKPHSPKPTYYLEDIGSEWITFPHEKDEAGILDHVIRIFSYIDIRLDQDEELAIINILNRIKK